MLTVLMMLLVNIPSFSSASAESIDTPKLVCLNIGKADAMLLFADNRTYLIDTGYEHTYPALDTALDAMNVTHIDGVFLTHVDKDHKGGLAPLAKSDVAVDQWYAASIYYDVKPEKHPIVTASAIRGQEVTWLNAGDVIPVSDTASFTVLGPLKTDTENENNNSLVLRFDSPHGSMLLCGDMKEEEERDLLSAGLLSPADLLKVGHHGDNKATTQPFLNAVQPKAAVISTSTLEETDTPAFQTMARLKAVEAETYVTQEANDALLCTLENGAVSVQDVIYTHIPAKIEGLTLAIDRINDVAAIGNSTGETVILSGAYLYSSKGNDVFELPDITLMPGESYLIGSEKSTLNVHYIAQKKRIWHEEDRDVGILYDAYGRFLCGTDNGRAE